LALSLAVGSGLPPFILFYPAVMIVAVAAGMGPGLAATGMASVVTAFLVLPSQGHPEGAAAADALGLALFVCMGVFMSIVAALFRRARQRAAEYQQELSLRESPGNDIVPIADMGFAGGSREYGHPGARAGRGAGQDLAAAKEVR
jgi:hypothetical protein